MPHNGLVRAIHRGGTLELVEPVDLPEGAEVWVMLQSPAANLPALQKPDRPTYYPTRPQPPETLGRLLSLIAVGGDALADSEALHDTDCN